MVVGASLPAATARSNSSPATLMSPAQARQLVIGCGVQAHRVSVSFEREWQEDIIWIAQNNSSLPKAKLACLARASLRSIYYVQFRNQAEQNQYGLIYERIEYQAEVSQARQWLAERRRLSTLPLPKKGAPLASYAKAVETFCGVKAGSLLVARGDDFITYTENGLGRITPNGIEAGAATDKQFECVSKATSAADLRSSGIHFGFVGNAANEAR